MAVIPLISFTGGEISPLLYGRIDLQTYYSSCKRMINFIPTQYGAAKKRPGFKFVARCKYQSRQVRLIPFVYSTVQAFALEFGDRYMRVHYDGGTLKDAAGEILEIKTPYFAQDIEQLQYTQSADCLFLVHHKYPPMKLSRKSNMEWVLEKMIFKPTYKPTAEHNATLKLEFYLKGDNKKTENDKTDPPIKAKYRYAVTFVDDDGFETELSTPYEVNGTYLLTFENYVKIIYTNNRHVPKVNVMKVYRNVNGFWCYTGRAKKIAGKPFQFEFIDNGTFTPVGSHNPPEYKIAFDSVGNYPRTVTFDTNRLVFGGTDNKPNTIWGSYIGNYNNFATYSTPSAVTPYEYTLTTDQVNSINWIRSASRLLVGTAGAEWRLSNLRADTPYDGKRSTMIGSKYVKALGVNENTLFISRVGKSVRSFTFNYSVNDFVSVDLCLFAEHLFRDRRIVDWSYSAEPFNIVWCVMDDGTMTHMVYNPMQDVAAWGRTVTDGYFQSVCSVPAKEEDHTYVVVERAIKGEMSNCVELMTSEYDGDIKKAVYLDSCVTLDNQNLVNVVQGLDHLENRLVSIVADGAVQTGKTVKKGTIKLDHPAKQVHIGLAYTATLETMELEGGAEDGGASQSRQRRVSSVKVRFENTVGGSAGTSEDTMNIIPFRDSTMPMGRALKAFSGFKDISPMGGFSDQATIIIKQELPMPMTVSAIYPRVSSHGR